MASDKGPFQLIRHPLQVRRLEVMDARSITPRMKRITLGGADLEGFVSLAPEDHVKLFFPAPGQAKPVLPSVGPTGMIVPAPQAERPIARDYTPIHHDSRARTVEVDFFLHGGGLACDWAARARPGQEIGMAGPRGSHVLRQTFDWQLLVGDETALPEMTRRLEELPPATRAFAVFAVEDPGEEQEIASRARPNVQWVHRRDGGGDLSARLVDAVARLDLPGRGGFSWLAGEAAEVKAVYRHLVRDRGFEAPVVRASGHWKRGVSNHDHHEEIAP